VGISQGGKDCFTSQDFERFIPLLVYGRLADADDGDFTH
jgi:hypothetical protein